MSDVVDRMVFVALMAMVFVLTAIDAMNPAWWESLIIGAVGRLVSLYVAWPLRKQKYGVAE